MASTLGNLDVLCQCGRTLHIPTDVVFVQTGQDIIAKIELDRGYLYAHTATWHRADDTCTPTTDARLQAVS